MLARRPTLSSTSSLLSLTSIGTFHFSWIQSHLSVHRKHPPFLGARNVLTSSHRLLLSWSRLQPFNFAVGFHLRRQRQQPAVQQLGLVISEVIDRELSLRSKPKGVPTAPSPSSTSGSPGSKLQSSSPPDARGVLDRNTRDFRPASGSPYLHVLGDQAAQCVCNSQSTPLPRDSWPFLSAVQAMCSLTDQALELPLCQHRGAPLHLHQRCARQSCFEELKRIIVVESHELSVLVSPHLSVVLTALSSSSAIDFCTVAILSTVLDNCSWNS